MTAAIGLAMVAGCSVSAADTGPAVPTFPGSTPSPTAAAPGTTDVGVVPDDCERLLKAADLGALLGLPLDSVGVHTTMGIPAPSVGRTERLDCAYTGTPGGPARGGPLLQLNAAAYTDAPSATAQWHRNADAEDGAHRDVPIGSASAVLVERRGEALLTVVYGSGTLTFSLPDRPLPGNRPRGDVLVDLALRVLPAIAAAAPTPAAPPPTTAGGPAQAAGVRVLRSGS
jgi:hypothetical protein